MAMFNHRVGRLTYPKMERQDLTQGQLGAFKFTPTDQVRPVFTEPSPMFPSSTKPYSSQINRTTARQLSPHKAQFVLNDHDPTQLFHHPPASPTRTDHTFFDREIKPDLENSRLRFGPNAVRVAVDGNSPTRKGQSWDPAAFCRALSADIMQSNQYPSLGKNRQGNSSTLNPSAPAFPAASSTAPEDNNPLYASLIRALGTEQQAHEVTKALLEAETTARLKAEAEAEKLLEHNRSLVGSVNMLKSVVQHNVKKERQEAERLEYQQLHHVVKGAGPTHAVKSASAEISHTIKAAEPTHTLLHDAVRNLKRPQKLTQNIAESPQEDQALDFTIPNTPEFASLRRHFSDAVEPMADTTFVDQSDDGQLISITPEKTKTPNELRDKSDDTWAVCVFNNNSSRDSDETANEDGFTLVKTKSKVAKLYDVAIRWTGEPIFDDGEDKLSRMGLSASRFLPNFYKHPVRYLPRQSDTNLYRTIMIDHIQPGTTYKEILEVIRGGAVESVKLYGPVGKSTNFVTARVVFNYELSARGVYMQGQSPGITIKGQPARVWQVLEPTYPRNPELEKEIFDEGFTRLLLIQNASEAALANLPTKLAYQMRAGFIIEITRTFDDLPMIEFASVAECSKALYMLINDPDFGGSKFDFEADPCEDPY